MLVVRPFTIHVFHGEAATALAGAVEWTADDGMESPGCIGARADRRMLLSFTMFAIRGGWAVAILDHVQFSERGRRKEEVVI